MSLFIQMADLKKIAQCEFENFYASYIDFDRQEWQFSQFTNQERDVEITYLFQFDITTNSDFFEIFHNGMDKAFLQNDILSEFPDFNHYFE